jgi:G:T-mismatch repair DNA endonuclease (very short patch repair protein)
MGQFNSVWTDIRIFREHLGHGCRNKKLYGKIDIRLNNKEQRVFTHTIFFDLLSSSLS